MSCILRLLTLAFAISALCACEKLRKPEQAPAAVAVKPEPVVITRRVYVPIPAEWTRAEPIAEGPIAQCFDVAAQRRAALERANAKLKKVDAVQGTEVKP